MVTIFDSESLKQGAPGEKLLFDYKGEVNEQIIPYILEKIDSKLLDNRIEIGKARRLGKICLEALQNIHDYYKTLSDENLPNGAYMYVYETGDGFSLLAANYLKTEHKLGLFSELKQLNMLPVDGRKDMYLSKLRNEDWSSRGGAGLGLIEMLWKSENRFKYEFEDVDPNYSIFILRLKIGKVEGNNSLDIQPTSQSPAIYFSPIEGKLDILGRSIPENAVLFYTPLFEAIREYVKRPAASTYVTISLDYINTSSSKCLLEVFKQLEQVHDNACNVLVKWCYEKGDDDMLEAGEDYDLIVNLPFEFSEEEEI